MVNEQNPAQEVATFMGRAMFAGRQAADDIEEVQRQNGGIVMDDRLRAEAFWDASSEFVVRTSSGNLSSGAIEYVGDNAGRGTQVVLPDDSNLNTRMLAKDNSMHARNNRLAGASGGTRPILPGMKDNLRPDYSNVSREFEAAAMNPTNLANSISVMGPSLFTSAAVSSMPSSADASSGTVPIRSSDDYEAANGLINLLEESDGDDAANKISENNLLLVYPFAFVVEELALREASSGMKELGGDPLGVERTNDDGPPDAVMQHDAVTGRSHKIVISEEDMNRLEPGQYLNDAIVDFWMRW